MARAPAMPAGTIRQLRPSDLVRFENHLLRLDAQGRRDRFNGPAKDDFVSTYARRCFLNGTTVIGFVTEDGEVHGAAELHERAELADSAEIAFSVEAELRGRGVGGRLFERLLLHAMALGYRRLLVTTHPANAAMKRLAANFRARLSFRDGETVGVIEIDPELAIAIMTRSIAEASGQAEARPAPIVRKQRAARFSGRAG